MKTIKDRVLKYMPKEEKVELQAEQIELGNIGELKALLKAKDSEIKNFDTFKNEWEKLQRARSVNSKMATDYMKEAAKALDEFNRKAKDLGLNSRDVKEYVELSEAFSEINTIVSEYNTTYKK